MPSEITHATVTSIEALTHDIYHLVLKTESPFPFHAGQFLSVHFPSDKQNAWRAYSIASRPHTDERTIELCVKRIPGGPASTYLTDQTIGARLEIKGPAGKFLANQEGVGRYVFVTTGSGISPLKSMIEDLLVNREMTTPIFLLFGFRSDADQFYLDRFDALAKRYSNFSYAVTLSQPSPIWTGARGRVTRYFDRTDPHMLPLKEDDHYYLCGVGEMVKEMRALLEGRGVSPARIHYERYN